ncbi:deoxyribose-phosphate aldolase [Mycobacterium sp. NPDC051198]
MTSDTPPTATEVAAMIDHTLLKPEATAADVEALIAEAVELGTYSVCVSPSMLPVTLPSGSSLKVAVVCGFPSGKHSSAVKAAEAAEAVRNGADEIDMVIDIGAAKEGAFDRVEADIAAVRAAAPTPTVLKVIIESAALTDDEIVGACRAAVAAHADFVKTSTGFHPTGGASVQAVELMHRTVRDAGLAVKASGGVRTLAQARAMIAAGATRLGVSGSRALLDAAESDGDAGY